MDSKFLVLIILFCSSCSSDKPTAVPETGEWYGTLASDGPGIPFNFRVEEKNGSFRIILKNGEEEIISDKISLRHDSLLAELPVFDSWLEVSLKPGAMEGYWTSRNRENNRAVKFNAVLGERPRFEPEFGPGFNVTGRWETGFYNPVDTAFNVKPAVAVFEQSGSLVTGTFVTTTGDYRYLEGIVDGRDLYLSSFDGAHAYFFHARFINNRLEGDFWSATGSHRNWLAERNEKFVLPDPDTLTKPVKGVPVSFAFPDLNGNEVSFPHEKYKGKVVIIQVLGSWCPNCMDETRFLSEMHEKYNKNGLEIIGLAFEYHKEREKASEAVRKMKENTGAGYTFLVAGNASKEEASEKLPFLTGIHSFPTTIFIDRKGKIVSVHTGYSGPATGYYYRQFREKTIALVENLL